MTSDIAIGIVGLPTTGPTLKKPTYLLCLNLVNKKTTTKFLALDKPEFANGFVQVKGFFFEGDDMDKPPPKDLIVEMYFPNAKVESIQNLIYKAK